jgi:hypothetical protein
VGVRWIVEGGWIMGWDGMGVYGVGCLVWGGFFCPSDCNCDEAWSIHGAG